MCGFHVVAVCDCRSTVLFTHKSMGDKRFVVQRVLGNGHHSPTKKAHASPLRTAAGHGNNARFDDREALERRLALHEAAIALAARATHILNVQSDPETLDLRPFASELNDALLNELASQLKASLRRAEKDKICEDAPQLKRQQRLYAALILSGCEKFTPVRRLRRPVCHSSADEAGWLPSRSGSARSFTQSDR